MRLKNFAGITARQTVGTDMCSGTPSQDYSPDLLVFIGHLVDTKVLTNYPRAVFFFIHQYRPECDVMSRSFVEEDSNEPFNSQKIRVESISLLHGDVG